MTVAVILFLTALCFFAVCFAGAALGSWWAQIHAPVEVLHLEPARTNHTLYGEPANAYNTSPYPWSPEGLAERYHV